MSDIVLVYPKTGMDIMPAIGPPHSVMAIATLPYKSGYKVRIIDQRIEHNWREILKGELDTKPLLVGISSMTGNQIKSGLEIASFVRNHNDDIPIVWGGFHPSLLPEQTLENDYVDIVCVGEGEYTLKDLADALSKHQPLTHIKGIAYKDGGKVIKTEKREYVDMNQMPEECWDLINVEKYIHPDLYLNHVNRVLDIGQTSRGCPFHCGMCGIGGHGWRAMSAEKTIDLINRMVKKYNLNGIWLRDDEFFISQKRAVQICEGMIPLKIAWYSSGTRIDLFLKTKESSLEIYKKSGANIFKFGAESGSNRILELIGKGFCVDDIYAANIKAKRLGIIPAYTLMAGLPTQTFEELDATVDMIIKMKKDNPSARFETLLVYTPMPGTPLWDLSIKYGFRPPQKLEDWINWRFDEYDDEGRRIPWYNEKDRKAIGNLCYLTSLTHVVPSLINSYKGFKGQLFKAIYKVPYIYFDWRFRHKSYRFMPELKLIRKMREIVLY
jgi:anaerobic magnesium-protoporphyrin IX monomethyl ester cyclase